MTQTEHVMQDLRNAIRDELVAELKTWWESASEHYEEPQDAIEDALNTLSAA